jgi:hypothetical protein
MGENLYDSSSTNSELNLAGRPRRIPSRGVRLSDFFAHCFLLFLFPPTCCPCGFGQIGFIIQPYLLLLGFPTILVGYIAPSVVDSQRGLFLAAYIANYVSVSYLIGELAGRLFARRPVHTANG